MFCFQYYVGASYTNCFIMFNYDPTSNMIILSETSRKFYTF